MSAGDWIAVIVGVVTAVIGVIAILVAIQIANRRGKLIFTWDQAPILPLGEEPRPIAVTYHDIQWRTRTFSA